MQYLAVADILLIHELLIAEFGGMRGITEAGYGRLEAALAQPLLALFGEELYPDAISKAAALTYALIRNHPLSDGNKRVGLIALIESLERSGFALMASQDEAYDMAMAVAHGCDVRWLEAWTRQHSVPHEAYALHHAG